MIDNFSVAVQLDSAANQPGKLHVTWQVTAQTGFRPGGATVMLTPTAAVGLSPAAVDLTQQLDNRIVAGSVTQYSVSIAFGNNQLLNPNISSAKLDIAVSDDSEEPGKPRAQTTQWLPVAMLADLEAARKTLTDNANCSRIDEPKILSATATRKSPTAIDVQVESHGYMRVTARAYQADDVSRKGDSFTESARKLVLASRAPRSLEITGLTPGKPYVVEVVALDPANVTSIFANNGDAILLDNKTGTPVANFKDGGAPFNHANQEITVKVIASDAKVTLQAYKVGSPPKAVGDPVTFSAGHEANEHKVAVRAPLEKDQQYYVSMTARDANDDEAPPIVDGQQSTTVDGIDTQLFDHPHIAATADGFRMTFEGTQTNKDYQTSAAIAQVNIYKVDGTPSSDPLQCDYALKDLMQKIQAKEGKDGGAAPTDASSATANDSSITLKCTLGTKDNSLDQQVVTVSISAADVQQHSSKSTNLAKFARALAGFQVKGNPSISPQNVQRSGLRSILTFFLAGLL